MRLKLFISEYSRYIYNTGSTHHNKHNKFVALYLPTCHTFKIKNISLIVVCFLLGNSPGSEQSVPKRRHVKFRRRGITQKKA